MIYRVRRRFVLVLDTDEELSPGKKQDWINAQNLDEAESIAKSKYPGKELIVEHFKIGARA